jgi:signal peptidase I
MTEVPENNGLIVNAPRRGMNNVLKAWIRDLVVALGIAGFVIIFLYQPVKVEGTSMLPGLEDQERIFINKFVYRFESIERGDVVVFRYPKDPTKSYIKRVVGVPGDKIRIRDGAVYLNGVKLDESYVPSWYLDGRSYPESIMGPHTFFLMGDHRNMSSDSREFGPVDESYIFGKAVFVYWPMERMGRLK